MNCLVEFTIFENDLDDRVQDSVKHMNVPVINTGDGADYFAKKHL